MLTLNLGILAHVDAGKTSLTERLLFAAGVIDTIGSVDRGDTQTDTLALERQRGITIKSAVASFPLGDLGVSLIDTPGHPDFIAEVERVLAVLDGAVLVISAVEGVQAQTRILMRALGRLGIPTLIFVNKIDRAGADCARVLRQIADRLTPQVLAMGAVREEGIRAASFASYGSADPAFAGVLAEHLADSSDAVLTAVIEGRPLPYERLRAELAAQVRSAAIHPVFFGSAITGAGIAELTAGFRDLMPPRGDDPDGPLSAMVFKVERGPAGEKVAFTRVFSGAIRVRDRVAFGAGRDGKARAGKVTGISVFGAAGEKSAPAVQAGQIARIRGLSEIRTGDVIGARPPRAAEHHFAPPALEAVVVPERPADRARMHAALRLLAEQDPLIDLRQDEARDETLLSLYGEVQKEVVQQTLADDFGIAVGFSDTTTLHIERPGRSGAAVERMSEEGNPFKATIGLRVDPGPVGSGVAFTLEIQPGSLPRAFTQAVAATARETLRQGLHGWEVTDCVITLTHSGYVPPPPTGWSKYSSSAADFRNLTPLVLMAALRRAGTAVLEPVHAFRIEAPADTLRLILPALARLGAVPRAPSLTGPECVIEGTIAAAAVRDLQLQLAPLTGGEGILESGFDHYAPVTGAMPVRRRSGPDPLNRREYLLYASGRTQECFANRQ